MNDQLNRIEALLDARPNHTYQRYDSEHPLDIYLGTDQEGRKSLTVIMNARRERIVSTKIISAGFFQRVDGQLMLSFSLQDDRLKGIFYKFCEDIIENTRLGSTDDGFFPVVERWNNWINFFSKKSLTLSENEVLGLIGEVYFLSDVLIKKYGQDPALESYIGTDRAHKDFEIQNTWFEVKSIHNGVRTVKISSIQQLDAEYPGNLEIMTFDQSTTHYDGNITLNQLIRDLRSSLDRKWQLLFDDKMRKAGYVEDERYDEYNYIFVRRDEYLVTDDFPMLTKDSLPIGITKASYEIDISAIERFKV